MEKFLSCDWGTSSFRLRLVETPNLTILKEKLSNRGIAETFQSWRKTGRAEDKRLLFYLDIIYADIREFERALEYPLGATPVILSGMVGSSIGMMDLPYKQLPFSVDGSDLIIKLLNYEAAPDSNVVLVSGTTTGHDVMRGEETQLVGCSHNANATAPTVFIFPGTHSKHVIVDHGQVVGFTTYMTGEFFKLLSTESILSVAVEEGSGFTHDKNRRSFEGGIEESVRSNLLHSSFQVRTNQLFNKFTKEENYYYLSGLLIGTEMNELVSAGYEKMMLVTAAQLRPYYEAAIEILVPSASLEVYDADEALIKGQFRILTRLLRPS